MYNRKKLCPGGNIFWEQMHQQVFGMILLFKYAVYQKDFCGLADRMWNFILR